MDASPSTSASVEKVRELAEDAARAMSLPADEVERKIHAVVEAQRREDAAAAAALHAADNPEDIRSHDNSSVDAAISAWVAAEEQLDEKALQEKAGRPVRVPMPPKKWGEKAYAERKRKAKASKASKRRNR